MRCITVCAVHKVMFYFPLQGNSSATQASGNSGEMLFRTRFSRNRKWPPYSSIYFSMLNLVRTFFCQKLFSQRQLYLDDSTGSHLFTALITSATMAFNSVEPAYKGSRWTASAFVVKALVCHKERTTKANARNVNYCFFPAAFHHLYQLLVDNPMSLIADQE